MTYRAPDPAAEIARLTRECERLRGELAAKRGRWGVRSPGPGAACGSVAGIAYSVASGGGTLAAGAVSLACCAVVWALLFLRRVPVEGGDR